MFTLINCEKIVPGSRQKQRAAFICRWFHAPATKSKPRRKKRRGFRVIGANSQNPRQVAVENKADAAAIAWRDSDQIAASDPKAASSLASAIVALTPSFNATGQLTGDGTGCLTYERALVETDKELSEAIDANGF